MTTPDHLGGGRLDQPDDHTFMPDIWERLVDDYKISSVIDVGCGGGWTTKWFADHGVRAVGVEADPAALRVAQAQGVRLLPHDYTQGPLVPDDEFDLGWCAEFVEHVEDAFVDNWLATMKRCRFVCMTFATPGQGGYHHVNERPETYWLERFAAAGFEHVPEETARMRATDRGSPWGRRTLTFFRRKKLAHFYSSVPGHFTFPDFYAWAAEHVPDGARCVEIGVYAGQSAACLGVELINAGKLSARLDLVDNGFAHWIAGGGVEGVRKTLQPVAAVIGDLRDGVSWEQAKFYEPRSIDFVFIDAGHEYGDVRRDIDAWLPKMRRGAIFAGHDYTPEIPGVIQAVVETFERFTIWRGSKWKDGVYYPVWCVQVP